VSVRWNEVSRILAFKKDCFTTDSIRLLFLTDSTSLEAGENDPGWETLIEDLASRVPGCERLEDWFNSVAFLAFEPCPKWIYGGDDSQETGFDGGE
jgi:hypothetical protein